MPSLITHYLYAQEVVRDNIPTHLAKIISHNQQEFSIGANGPDVFFYYNAWPFKDQKAAKRVSSYGGIIHAEKINDFFSIVFQEVKKKQDQAVISYISGLLCHWALDKTCHPYIFNQTESNDSYKSTIYHRRFESALDYHVLKLIKGETCREFAGYKTLSYGTNTGDTLFNVYVRALRDVYHIDLTKKEMNQCVKDFYQIQKFLYDPKGKKNKFYFNLEKKILKKPYAFTSMIVPISDDGYDVMNNQHRLWVHPCTKKTSNESFIDLFNSAIQLGQEVLTAFYRYLKEEIELEDLLKLINNESFETGMDILMKMQYFDCIYERK